ARRAETMGAGAEEGALGDAHVGLQRDGSEAENEHFLTQPDVIADREPPGEGDVYLRPDNDSVPDPGAEGAEQRHAQSRRPREPVLEEDDLCQHPQQLLPARRAAVEVAGGIAFEPHYGR